MAKTAAVQKREWKLCDGVGFAPEAGNCPERLPAIHYVVLMQSMHSGTDAYGPFLTEAAAYEWIRTGGEDALYQLFDKCAVPGV